MLNQDKVVRVFQILLVVIVLALIASSWYHSEKTTNDTPIAAMSRSGGL